MCTPPCPLGSLQHSRKPITGFKGGFAAGGNGGGLLRSCRREGKEENEREREGGISPNLLVIDASAGGVRGTAPADKNEFHVF